MNPTRKIYFYNMFKKELFYFKVDLVIYKTIENRYAPNVITLSKRADTINS